MELPVRLLRRAGWDLLELITRHDQPAVASSGRFSSADLLRISEIGLAVPDVPAAVATLQDAFGLPVFGTAAAEFTPPWRSRRAPDRGPAGPTMVPTTTSRRRWPYRCHRRAAKRREVGGTDRELPSQGRVTASVGASVAFVLRDGLERSHDSRQIQTVHPHCEQTPLSGMCKPLGQEHAEGMTDGDFLDWVKSTLYEAERALRNGDLAPRRAIWSRNEPVSILGALRNAYGQHEVDEAFTFLERSFSDCTSYTFELQAYDVAGDMAYTAGLEHASNSFDGQPRSFTLRATQVYRREGGEWKVAHRHADTVTE
jgi:ketosteroid isomerase-like protein